MIKIGVYEIVNKINNKRYVGCSKDIEKRWSEHFKMLTKNKHHSIKLQGAWNKHGKDSFDFNVLELCKFEDIFIVESSYINKFDSMKNGYNMVEGVVIKNTLRTKNNVKKNKYYFTFKNEVDDFVSNFEDIKELYTLDICPYDYNNLHLNPFNKTKTPKRIIKFVNMLPLLLYNLKRLKNDNESVYYIQHINYLDKHITRYDLVEFNIIKGKTYKNNKRNYNHNRWNTDFNHILKEFIFSIYLSNHKYMITFLDNVNDIFKDNERLYRGLLKFYNNNKESE